MKFKGNIFYLIIIGISLFTFCKPKQTGQKTVIKPEEKKDTSTVVVQPPVNSKTDTIVFDATFLMPFHFDENLNTPANDMEETELAPSSLPSLEFYEGAKMAADSFHSEKIKINLKVYDAADSARLETLLKGFRIYNSNILFVNTPPAALSALIKGAELNKTPVVYAQSASVHAAHLMSCVPNNQSMISEMARYIATHYEKEKVIVVYRDVKKEKELGEWFGGRIDTAFVDETGHDVKCTLVNYAAVKLDGLVEKLDKNKKNLIVVASSDEAFISPLLSSLSEKTDVYRLQVCGLPTWENFETVSETELEKLETLIFSSNYINYDDAELQKFRRSFIAKYSTDPIYQAYQGFYLMKGFIEKRKSGKEYWKDLNKYKSTFNSGLFNFSGSNPVNGYENTRIYVLKFSNYKLELQPY